MKVKIDENLPGECAALLRGSGFEADTVADEYLTGAEDATLAIRSQAENRVFITLDLDFANIRAYPPEQYPGIVVLRPKRQDKRAVLSLTRRVALLLANRAPAGELWIVEPDRVRFRAR